MKMVRLRRAKTVINMVIPVARVVTTGLYMKRHMCERVVFIKH